MSTTQIQIQIIINIVGLNPFEVREVSKQYYDCAYNDDNKS